MVLGSFQSSVCTLKNTEKEKINCSCIHSLIAQYLACARAQGDAENAPILPTTRKWDIGRDKCLRRDVRAYS